MKNLFFIICAVISVAASEYAFACAGDPNRYCCMFPEECRNPQSSMTAAEDYSQTRNFQCAPSQSSMNSKLQGQFKEIPNRNGQGQILISGQANWVAAQFTSRNDFNQYQSLLNVSGRVVGTNCSFGRTSYEARCTGHYVPCGNGCCRIPNM